MTEYGLNHIKNEWTLKGDGRFRLWVKWCKVFFVCGKLNLGLEETDDHILPYWLKGVYEIMFFSPIIKRLENGGSKTFINWYFLNQRMNQFGYTRKKWVQPKF